MEVGNGLACIGSCEEEVARLNEQIQRGRKSFAKGGASYLMLSVVNGVMGAALIVSGLMDGINPITLLIGAAFPNQEIQCRDPIPSHSCLVKSDRLLERNIADAFSHQPTP